MEKKRKTTIRPKGRIFQMAGIKSLSGRLHDKCSQPRAFRSWHRFCRRVSTTDSVTDLVSSPVPFPPLLWVKKRLKIRCRFSFGNNPGRPIGEGISHECYWTCSVVIPVCLPNDCASFREHGKFGIYRTIFRGTTAANLLKWSIINPEDSLPDVLSRPRCC